MKKLSYDEIKNTVKKHPITIVCDMIRTPENIGMTFRIADSFGVEKIFIHETSPTLENKTVIRTSRNTIPEIEHEYYADFEKLIDKLKSEGNRIIGIEITDKSVNLQEFNFSNYEKIVLLLGSERNGITRTDLIDDAVAIPMYGKNSSMNAVNSLAITLYEVTNQLK